MTSLFNTAIDEAVISTTIAKVITFQHIQTLQTHDFMSTRNLVNGRHDAIFVHFVNRRTNTAVQNTHLLNVRNKTPRDKRQVSCKIVEVANHIQSSTFQLDTAVDHVHLSCTYK